MAKQKGVSMSLMKGMGSIREMFGSLLFCVLLVFGSSASAANMSSRYAAEVRNKFIESVEKAKGYACCSVGGSLPGGNIRWLTVTFAIPGKPTLQEARKIEVELLQEFSETIDSHPGIRAYLRNYPSGIAAADVGLRFRENHESDGSSDRVAVVYNIRGDIIYKAYDQESQEYVLLHKEPYEEALRIVAQAKKSSIASQ